MAAALAAIAALTGCGGSGSGLTVPTVAPARVYSLGGFAADHAGHSGSPGHRHFTVLLPSGKPLTHYKTGSGPHTGVHLIIVRDDLAYIIHQHPPIGPNGLLRQTVTFPAPGPYRVARRRVSEHPGRATELPAVHEDQRHRHLPAVASAAVHVRPVVDGYHFDMHAHPQVHAIQAQFINVTVTDSHGHKPTFVPWFGALAHAIFFRQGSLDYFHTHICAPNAPNCGALPGVASSRISGSSTAPGKLTIGVLLPVPGTWRLFLQMKLAGRIVTAPYTLDVAS